ncbi:hypothetical protein ACFLZ5_05930 [Thermodesulfobacteriota bacterium]
MTILYGFGQFLYAKLTGFLVFLLIPCFFLSACQPPIKQVDSLKAKVLEAHGGVKALGQVSTIVFKGEIVTRSDRGTIALILSRPRKLRATMKYLKRYEDRILLENEGWRNFGDGFEKATGHSFAAMIFQNNHLNLPMGLLGDNYKTQNTEQKIDPKIFPVLKLTSEAGPPMAVVIDPETGLINRVDGKIATGSREVMMGVDYGDYREVAGVMVPHRIINFVNGIAIAESRFDTVQVNVDLDPGAFYIDPQSIVQ